MASSYDYIHDQIVCKSCVEDHKLRDIDIEAFEGLLSQNPEWSSLKESTDQIFLPTFLKGLSGFVLAINLLLTFKYFLVWRVLDNIVNLAYQRPYPLCLIL